MPLKHSLSIDFAKLQGAFWFTHPGTKEECLIIVPSKSRMKRYPSKKEGVPASLWGRLEIVPLKNPPVDREDTHFVKEPTTREERAQPNPPELPYLGNAREYAPYGSSPNQPKATTATAPAAGDGFGDGLEEDDIPF